LKEKVNSAVLKLLSKSFNGVLGSGYIFRGRGERKADAGSLIRKFEGFTEEGKEFVINCNIFTLLWRRHSSDSVVKTRITHEFFKSC
jgi:hypothetical protein